MLTLAAPAKLNLFLHITGKRADGYHLLESLVAFTDFGDRLTVAEADTLTLDIIGPFASALPLGDNNLILRAARLLHPSKGAKILLEKHLPIGSGIGGGSSDAAAALNGLARLWNMPMEDGMQAEALSLGSDVPVCLHGKTAWMSGVGEQVQLVEMQARPWVVLVNPAVPLLTAEVFRRFAGSFDVSQAPPQKLNSVNDVIQYLADMHNALELPAMQAMPVIGEILKALRDTEGCLLARMSGSGATCFALYEEQHAAEQAAAKLKANADWWVQVTRLR